MFCNGCSLDGPTPIQAEKIQKCGCVFHHVTKSKHVYVDDSKTKNAFSIEIVENDIPRRPVPAEELKGI